jgi:dihydroneopterin aldolase
MEVLIMRKNCGSIAENGRVAMKTIVDALTLKVFADEPASDDDNKGGEDGNSSKSTINYEDLIAKARKEEKEKQYKTIEKLKKTVETLTEQHNNDLLSIAELGKKVEEAEAKLTTAGKGDSEEITTLKSTIETLKKEKKALEDEVTKFKEVEPVDRSAVEAEVRQQLEAEYEVKTYKATKLLEMKDEILVPELVMGDTKEAIDESIKAAMERSKEIRKSLGISDKPKKTPKAPANPSVDGIQDSGVDLDRLAKMDVRSPEYAELRKQLGLK